MKMQEVTPHTQKVLFGITKGSWGGASRYVFDLATNLPQNYECAVITGTPGLLIEKLTEASLRTYTIPTLSRDMALIKEIRSFFTLLSHIKKERPDILHLNSPKMIGLGALAGRLCGVKNITATIHGWSFNEERPYYQKALIYFFSYISALLCHHVIVISKSDLSQGRALPFVSNKISLVYLGITKPPLLPKEKAQEILFTGKIAEYMHKQVVTIAELHTNKNLENAVRAVVKYNLQFPASPLQYTIIGGGEEKDRLTALIRSFNADGLITLTDFKKDASQYLSAFNVFLLPSKKEGLPYVLLEAGYSGLFLIGSLVGGIPDIIDSSLGGALLSSTTEESIFEALCASPWEESLVVVEARSASFQKKFALRDMLTKTFALYK